MCCKVLFHLWAELTQFWRNGNIFEHFSGSESISESAVNLDYQYQVTSLASKHLFNLKWVFYRNSSNLLEPKHLESGNDEIIWRTKQ